MPRASRRAKDVGTYRSSRARQPYEHVYKTVRRAFFIKKRIPYRKKKRYLNAAARRNIVYR